MLNGLNSTDPWFYSSRTLVAVTLIRSFHTLLCTVDLESLRQWVRLIDNLPKEGEPKSSNDTHEFFFFSLIIFTQNNSYRGFDPAKSHGTLHDWSKMPRRQLRMWTINVVIYDTLSWIHYRTESINATFNTINYLLPVWINVFQLLK